MNNLPPITCETFPSVPIDFELWGLGNSYNLILKFYANKRANRSQVPLINHIIEGIAILKYIDASPFAAQAFCIHPLVQTDQDLNENIEHICKKISPKVIALAIEYRSVANEYLSHRVIKSIDEIRLSPLKDVNDMLIADKVQNYRDFLIYHAATHSRSKELDVYFRNWMDKLECWDIFKVYEPLH